MPHRLPIVVVAAPSPLLARIHRAASLPGGPSPFFLPPPHPRASLPAASPYPPPPRCAPGSAHIHVWECIFSAVRGGQAQPAGIKEFLYRGIVLDHADQGSSNRKSCLAAANIEENGIDAMLRMGSTCRRHKPAAPRLEGALEENTMVGGCYRGPVMGLGCVSTIKTKLMEFTHAGCKKKIPDHLFMCSELYIAAYDGQTDEVVRLLGESSGVAVESPTIRATPAAQAAACNIHEVTAERSTLLHVAAAQGHCDLIAELCRRDSNLLSAANSTGDTPLHCVARAGHTGAILAIARFARDSVEEDRLREILRGKNSAGDTALHLAARHGHGEAASELVAIAPAMASELNGSGMSPLYLAVMSRSVAAVRAVLSCGDASAAGPDSQNALHAAVLQNPEMVSLLLQWREELATQLDSSQSTPLHYASSDGDCSVIQEILKHTPPSATQLQDSDGLSALHVAALMGHTTAVRLLLKFSPASADIRDNHGRTFLHVAAMRGHVSVISYAIKNRMLMHILNEQDNEGNTPLHLAVIAGEYKVISKLLYSGKVQNHIMNYAGHTPYDLAEKSTGFYTMVRIILKLYVSGAQFRPQRQDHIVKWNGQDIIKWQATTSKYLAIVSTLVATIAFSATFNMPGSYGSDGKANLNGDRLYHAFVVLDTVAVTTSVVATILLLYGRIAQSHRSWPSFIIAMHSLWLSLICMLLAFFISIIAVMDKNNSIRIAPTRVMYHGLYILMMMLTKATMPGSVKGILMFLIGGRLEQERRAKRRIRRQYPLIVVYIFNIIVFAVVTIMALTAIDVIGNLRY
uniref:PGG domain-containing protein n=1 Tax=Oryza rufipogon TaxID=4529 RepID=A0A0E0R7S3_ORYRU